MLPLNCLLALCLHPFHDLSVQDFILQLIPELSRFLMQELTNWYLQSFILLNGEQWNNLYFMCFLLFTIIMISIKVLRRFFKKI